VVFLLGGFLAVLFHNASRETRVQCNACGAIFGFRKSSAEVALVILWLLIAPTILILVCWLLSAVFSG
jgi:hypothetical protein